MSAEQERRAPVQGERANDWITDRSTGVRVGGQARPRGTIAWWEHLEVWEAYAARYGKDQDAERIAQRGGFGWNECTWLLGREPSTWRAKGGAR